MRMTFPKLVLALVPLAGLILLPGRAARADATTEAQLRAALQQATAQIAALENRLAALQAQEAPDQAQIAALQVQVQTLKQQASQGGGQGAAQKAEAAASEARQAAADKQLAALRQSLARQDVVIGKLQAAYRQAAAAANAGAAQNARLNTRLTSLRQQNEGCTVKNAALYKLGNQILDQLARRDNFWSSLATHEPFIGFARVKLQNIVQSDQDKLDDNRVNPQ